MTNGLFHPKCARLGPWQGRRLAALRYARNLHRHSRVKDVMWIAMAVNEPDG